MFIQTLYVPAAMPKVDGAKLPVRVCGGMVVMYHDTVLFGLLVLPDKGTV